MGAGAVRFRHGTLLATWSAQVDGGDKKPSSHRPEVAALSYGVQQTPLRRDLFIIADNQSTL
eukprot:2854878-Rhodomonas_salina.1